MKRLVEFKLDPTEKSETVLFEVEEAVPFAGRVDVGASEVIAQAVDSLDKVMGKVRQMAQSVISHIRSFEVSEATVEFGVKFNAESGVIFASASAEANLKITLRWDRAKV